MKRCPRCRTNLAEVRISNVAVDGCTGCGGVWFDNSELGAVANTASTDLLALEDQFLPGTTASRAKQELICPCCAVDLFEFEFPHSPGVRVNGCPQCKGVWTDDGELKAIYTRMVGAAHVAEEPASDARNTARHALGILVSRPCHNCKRPNACWCARVRGQSCGGPRSEPTLACMEAIYPGTACVSRWRA